VNGAKERKRLEAHARGVGGPDPVSTAPTACSASVIGDNLIRFGFTDAQGNSVSIPLTRDQAESYAIMLARFIPPESRARLVVVVEDM
jgi:hypothetical protein